MSGNGKYLRKTVSAALFLALGMILPLLTAQVKEIGDTLLPMHLPVMLCGLICGWQYGASVGLLLPFCRAAVFGMPPLYPNAVWMAAELATYGLVLGLLYARVARRSTPRLLLCLAAAMIAGRLVWGIVKAVLLGLGGNAFTLHAFIIGGFADALPGILLQFLLIPLLMRLYERRFPIER